MCGDSSVLGLQTVAFSLCPQWQKERERERRASERKRKQKLYGELWEGYECIEKRSKNLGFT